MAVVVANAVCAPGRAAAGSESGVYDTDRVGRLTRAAYSTGNVLAYEYDAVGNRRRASVGSGATSVGGAGYFAAADFNADGVLDRGDLALLRGAALSGSGTECAESRFDLTSDEIVDRQDVILWLSYFGSFWMPADWTGPVDDANRPAEVLVPDERVDFFDLAVVTAQWGQTAVTSPGSEPVGVRDLERLSARWNAGGGPVYALCGGEPVEAPESLSELMDEGARVFLRPIAADGGPGGAAVLEAVLGAASDRVAAFQFTLKADLPAGTDFAAREGAASAFDVGSVEMHPLVKFREATEMDGRWVLAGAWVEGERTGATSEQVLCTITVPFERGEHAFEISEIAYSTTTGAIRRASPWSQSLFLSPLPREPVLAQNFPNPFRASTSIEFAIPTERRVELAIHDVSGRLVRRLVDELLPAGWHHRDWDGKSSQGQTVANGVYFVRMNAGRTTESRKLVLVR